MIPIVEEYVRGDIERLVLKKRLGELKAQHDKVHATTHETEQAKEVKTQHDQWQTAKQKVKREASEEAH